MTIAWRRLDDVPQDDPLPWLYGTARNLVLAEARRSAVRTRSVGDGKHVDQPPSSSIRPWSPLFGALALTGRRFSSSPGRT